MMKLDLMHKVVPWMPSSVHGTVSVNKPMSQKSETKRIRYVEQKKIRMQPKWFASLSKADYNFAARFLPRRNYINRMKVLKKRSTLRTK